MKDKAALQSFLLRLFPVVLVLFSIFLSAKNYSPNTYLTGWDTLHPEFNFTVYWERILNGAWQDHQGLGTVATQAHSGEIPRVVLLQALDFVFPTNMLRYLYMFLMLVLGPLGVYFLLKELYSEADPVVQEVSAFIGALFYLLNLSTLQHFYVPLEMFPTHFGALGWLLLFLVKYLKGHKRSLLGFAIVSFLAAPQAHTSTLFIALFISIFAILVVHLIFSIGPKFSSQLNKGLFALLVLLLTNLFWLGPNVYFIVTEADSVADSKIHSLFSEEAILQNQQYGSLEDVAFLRGFLFNWGEHVGNGTYGDLLDEWDAYYSTTPAQGIYYVVFSIAVLGLALALIKKNRWLMAFAGSLFISYFFIANSNPPFGVLYDILQEGVPLFKEGFRFPFTKFSTILALSYAVFSGYAITQLLNVFRTSKLRNLLAVSIAVLSIVSFIYAMYPAFEGNLISKSMRVDIPDRYFEMFEFFDSQNKYGRVANLPMQSFWGWVYYNWEPVTHTGYQGAGFLWFGIKQPLLDREFDRWGSSNEQYFREMSYAIYSQDVGLLENLLVKYKVQWLLVDESVFQPGADEKLLYLTEIKTLLDVSEKIQLVEDFGGGLYVYEVLENYSHITQGAVIPLVGDVFEKESYDPIYEDHGDYIVTNRKDYPFVGVTSQGESLLGDVISSTDLTSTFSPKLSNTSSTVITASVNMDTTVQGTVIRLKDFFGGEILATVPVSLDRTSVLDINGSVVKLGDSNPLAMVTLEEEENLEVDVYSPNASVDRYSSSFSVLEPCSVVGEQTAYTLTSVDSGFSLSARNVNACVTTPLETVFALPEKEEVILDISVGVDELGAAADLCLFDEQTGGCIGSLSRNEDTVSLLAKLKTADFKHYYLRFFANSRDERETSVLYTNLTFQEMFLSDSVLFDNILFPTVSSIGDSLTFDKELVLTAEELKFLSSPHICGSGSRDLEGESVYYENSGVVYQTDKEFLCDTFKLSTLSSSEGYLLEVVSKNTEGPSQRLCVTNQASTRCDLYVSLPKKDDYVKSYYMLPPTQSTTYSLNLTSLVFGEEGKSRNEISYISFTPIPYKALKHLSTFMGESKVNTLVLNEAYNAGWLALCGVRICPAEHVLVSNWANGWVFENADIPASVKIVFWPQILQYFGYIVLFGTLFFLIIPRKNKD